MSENTDGTETPLELIDKKELARRLSCTTRHIDNLTIRGLINKIKLGTLSRYDWLEVVESLKNQNEER